MVLKRRRGIPISLAVLYLEMASQVDIPVRGVAFPGHFLLRVTLPEGDAMIDPTTGHPLTEAEMVEMLEPYVAKAGESVSRALRMLLQPATRREIIARMLRNLKATYLQTERWQRMLAVQRGQPAPRLTVDSDTKLLVIAPHPDDEVLGAGGLMQRVRAAGGMVHVVYLTDGDGYPEGVRAEQLDSTVLVELAKQIRVNVECQNPNVETSPKAE